MWHQQPTRRPQSLSLPSFMTKLDDLRFCRFCLATNHPKTQCTSIPPQLHAKFISTREPKIPTLPRRPNGLCRMDFEDAFRSQVETRQRTRNKRSLQQINQPAPHMNHQASGLVVTTPITRSRTKNWSRKIK